MFNNLLKLTQIKEYITIDFVFMLWDSYHIPHTIAGNTKGKNEMTITLMLTKKSVYGNELIYPVNDKARLFVKLLNKKTFSVHDLRIIGDLGFNFSWV